MKVKCARKMTHGPFITELFLCSFTPGARASHFHLRSSNLPISMNRKREALMLMQFSVNVCMETLKFQENYGIYRFIGRQQQDKAAKASLNNTFLLTM